MFNIRTGLCPYGARSIVAYALIIFTVFLSLACITPQAYSGLVFVGDVIPDPDEEPSDWDDGYVGEIRIGETGYGSLEIDDGTMLDAVDTCIGCGRGHTGEITITGAGSSFYVIGDMGIGHHGFGYLYVYDGGYLYGDASLGNAVYFDGSIARGEVTVSGPGSTWDAFDIVLGSLGAGELNITNGGTVNGYVSMGKISELIPTIKGVGEVNVAGTGSTLNGYCEVGDEGYGALNISSGGTVNGGCSIGDESGSSGTVNVSGAGSILSGDLSVGFHGSGTLNISDGGMVDINSTCSIASQAGSIGAANVSGTDSIWTCSGKLYIGEAGNGTLTIDNSGTVDNTEGHIGRDPGSTAEVTVDGAGSIWTCEQSLFVGNAGDGAMAISHSGTVNASAGYIGGESDSTGEVTVDGVGSTWTCDSSLDVGAKGEGALAITNGGAVDNSWCSIGYDTGSTGVVTVDGAGSILTCTDGLSVGSLGSGTLTITNGGAVNSGSYCCISGWESTSNSVVTVDGADSTLTCGGSLEFGNSGNGTLTISNGATVSVEESTSFSVDNGSTVNINFGANGGTLTTGDLYCSPTQLTGTGTINTRGLVSDVDLVFDATHGLIQTVSFNEPGQNITVNLNVTSSRGSASDLGVGFMDNGSMVIRDAVSVVSDMGFIGLIAGSNGTVTVDGIGSTWTCNEGLFVGLEGIGSLTITNGGAVNLGIDGYIGGWGSGASGEVIVDGAGSTLTCKEWLHVSNYGNSKLTISNGASVSVEGTTYVVSQDGSTGIIDFGVNGGTLTTGSLYCSPSQLMGTGTINTRGLVSDIDFVFDATHGVSQALLINESGQNVTINLDFSGASNPAGILGVGYIGNGSMVIRDAVSVTSTYGYIGFNSGSSGEVTVDGAGSAWNCDEGLSVGGEEGNGTLTISNGGMVDLGGTGSIGGWESGSTGEVTIDGAGSTLNCDSWLYVGNYGSGIGKVNITNGGLMSVTGTMTIDPNGDGNDFIDMYFGGMLALLGNADDSLSSFLGLIDGTDAIRYWDDSTSGWVHIIDATPAADYMLSYQTEGDLAGYTVLTVLAALAGDANGDGDVDVSDLGVLATNYGTTSGAEWSDADFNGDGAVDVSDLGVLATKYGSSTAGEPTEAVPEPSGMVLIVMGAVVLLGCVRRRK